jgi:hypothetical protein
VLTDDEKQAGRLFKGQCQETLSLLNRESPPDGAVLPFWKVARHECAASGGASIGITLRERYIKSPEYRVCYCGSVGAATPDFPHSGCDGSKVIAAGGLFGFRWKEGRCGSGCGRAVRSKEGVFVIAADRPPENGRVHVERGQAGPHPGDL